ncbi:hypothetical protein BKA63DRAFT_587607 [Paraphoma chrysanthemicola]|nr:hypothetical protein BKA63DRAFT_587607 [Paraphoma chrysanthemicola]
MAPARKYRLRSQSVAPSWPRRRNETGPRARRLERRLKHHPSPADLTPDPAVLHKVSSRTRKTADKIRKVANKLGQRVRDHRRPLLYAAATGVATVGLVWVTRNALAYSAQIDPLVTQYKTYPQHLHTKNAYTVLGLSEPWYEGWIPPQELFRAAARRVNKAWHPDKSWAKSGSKTGEEAKAIWEVYKHAITLFEDYYEKPMCQLEDGDDAGLLAPMPEIKMGNNTNLQHYDNFGGDCTLWRSLGAAIKGALTHPSHLPPMPQTEEQRLAYYPCSLRNILKDFMTNMQNIPPLHVPRFWDTPSLEEAELVKNPINWMMYRLGRTSSWFPGPTEWNQTQVMESSMGSRWLTAYDFDESLPICEMVNSYIEVEEEKESPILNLAARFKVHLENLQSSSAI